MVPDEHLVVALFPATRDRNFALVQLAGSHAELIRIAHDQQGHVGPAFHLELQVAIPLDTYDMIGLQSNITHAATAPLATTGGAADGD
jgi:hypothetical protein